jgi:hypothetical protein
MKKYLKSTFDFSFAIFLAFLPLLITSCEGKAQDEAPVTTVVIETPSTTDKNSEKPNSTTSEPQAQAPLDITTPEAKKVCGDEQEAVNSIAEKFKQTGTENDLAQEGKQLAEDAQNKIDNATKGTVGGIGLKLQVKWGEQRFSLKLPEFKLGTQEIKLDLPQVSVKENRIIFEIPATRMGRQKTGQYPEFTCRGLKCTVSWTDIYMDVPEFYMERHEIVLGIPEFTWDTTSIKLDIIEVSMKDQDIIILVPEFTLVDASGKVADEVKEETDKFKGKVENYKNQFSTEIGSALATLYTCYKQPLISSRSQLESNYNEGILKLQQAITQIRANGADPSNITNQDGTTTNLNAKLEELITARDREVQKIDAEIAKLDSQEKQNISGVTR